MLNPPTLQATPNAISLLASASGAMRYVNQDGLTVDLFGRVVARANPSAQQATGGGVTDKRHLWPTWFNLIRECRPPVIFGEQVESAINHGWLDLVQADLERENYACGAVGLPAGGVGAPHIRQRLWFVAHTDSGRHDGWASATRQQAGASAGLANGGAPDQLADTAGAGRKERQHRPGGGGRKIESGECEQQLARHRATDQLADSQREGLEGHIGDERNRDEPGRLNAQPVRSVAASSAFDQLADANGTRSAAWVSESNEGEKRDAGISDNSSGQKFSARFRPENFWSDCDWLPCRDGKARPVEPGTFPLAYGSTARVGRLRAYGNAIVPQVAQTFIEAYLES
jgi:DNA (cytosine-5)-methyltransferase 1